MNAKQLSELVSENITFSRGYVHVPSCVCEASDAKNARRVRSVAVQSDGSLKVNAKGKVLTGIKRAIRQHFPGAKFVDEIEAEAEAKAKAAAAKSKPSKGTASNSEGD